MMDRLLANQQLNAGQELSSNSGWFRLLMDFDGNVELYRAQTRLVMWDSNTVGQNINRVVMQADGDLVALDVNNVAGWRSNTAGNPGASVVMQDDGNLVLLSSTNHPLWASNTAQDLNAATIVYNDGRGYNYNETSESWKALCSQLPCFAAIHWPGYDTSVIEDTIGGQPVVIQLWKGLCPNLLQVFRLNGLPGGIGAEVGIYHRIPGKAKPLSLPFLPAPIAAALLTTINGFADQDLWWPFPELQAKVEYTLTNPVTNQVIYSAGPETTYWMAKWMNQNSYGKYQNDQGGRTPPNDTDYILNYKINGKSYPGWPPRASDFSAVSQIAWRLLLS